MSTFYNSSDEAVKTGRELGRGGEGAVFELADDATQVAKIYHEAIDRDKAEKLRQMVALKSDKLLKLAAWVTDTLHDAPHGRTVGFMMPRVKSGAAIHELYNPRSRRQHFPEADWRFLIAAASNLARAFSTVHAHGHTIGDVNHGNVVIARDATVRLIDCDSYHLNAPDKSYLCEVGVSTHTPPELQGHTLRALARTENHDRFGLAVLIFQLLFMGRHPFSGAYLGDGENTLEESIKNRRFAYGDDAATRKMRQPPGSLPLAAVSTNVKDLFERAFLNIENRPTAREWVEALDDLGENLQQCNLNSAHFYLKTLEKCAWCKLESETGVMFFPARLTGEWGANGEIDLYTLGQLIDQIQPPDVSQSLAKLPASLALAPSNKLPASPKVKQALQNYNAGLAAYLAVLGISIVLLVAFVGFGFLFYVFQLAFGGFWICWGIIKSLTKTAREETQLTLDAAHQKWQNFKDQTDKKNLLQPFEAARAELKTAIKQYSETPKQRETRLKELEAAERKQQLDIYLKRFSIKKAEIAGLDDSRIEVLKLTGIKNAFDLTNAAFSQIPHFSHLHKKKLFDWRAGLEKEFVFKFSTKLKQEIQQTAENDISAIRLQLEARLRNGLPDLQRIANQINQKQQNLTAESETLAAEVQQAETDFKQVSDLQKQAIAWTIGVAVAGFAVGAPVRNLISPEVDSSNQSSVERDYNYGGRVTSSSSTAVKPIVSIEKDVVTPQEWGKAGELYEQGEKLLKAEKYNQAAVAFNTAAQMKPGVEPIYKRLAESYNGLKRYQDALNAYDSALSVDPDDYESHYNTAIIRSRLGQWDAAAAEFRSAGLSDRVIPRTAAEVGARLRATGKYQAAIDYLKDAVKQKSNEAEMHYELGMCYHAIDDYAKVKQEYRKLKDLDAALAQDLYETAFAPVDGDNHGYGIGHGSGANAPPPAAPGSPLLLTPQGAQAR